MRIGMTIASLGIVCGLFAAVPAGASATNGSALGFAALIASAKADMLGEPAKALTHARSAGRAAALLPNPRARGLAKAEAAWLEGEALTRINKPDEAKPVIDAARATVERYGPNSKLHGDLMRTSAAIEGMTGHVQDALSHLQSAYNIFVAAGETRSQAIALQDIGSIYFDARDYPRMLKYYAQSAELSTGDPGVSISALNNQGDGLKELKRFPEAIASYGKALAVARSIRSDALEVRILTNLASAYLQSGDPRRADVLANRGLVAARGKDTGWDAFLWGVKAQAALAQGRIAEARGFIERTFAGAKLDETTTQYREFHETASRIYASQNEPAAALVHLTAFKRLDDELREIAVSTNAGLMTARFDFANQELSIAKLKAGQLQRDVALERSKARLSKFTLYGLGAALLLAGMVLAGALWSLFSIRRSRNEVRRANDTLSGVNAELETALAARTRFLSTTSHEIRTPLNGILGMTQVMLHDRDLVGVQRDRVRIVHDAGETMKALVDDILDIAKIETGTVVIDRSEVALRDMLGGVARLWTGQANAKGLTLEADIDGCPERVLGDERRLRQIVFNLLSNAIKFTETGTVSLHAAVHDDVLTLRISDTGIGIPADQLEAVFTSFHQVDGATTRRYGGTGLGLAICHDLVSAMEGSIALESELGVGSSFTVRLPVEVATLAVVPINDMVWPATLADAQLLIVEDNPLACSIMAAALQNNVAKVVAVGSDLAIATFASGSFHHVVADCVALSQIDDAATFIGDVARGPHGAVTTLLTAIDLEPELTAAYVRAGMAQLLRRPIAPAALAEALATAHNSRSEVSTLDTADLATNTLSETIQSGTGR